MITTITPDQAWDNYQAVVTQLGVHCAHELSEPSDRKRLTDAWQEYCRSYIAHYPR